MRFSDLSRADQELLQSDLGNFDKVAAEQVALIDEMYSTGFNKLAAETADMLDKLAEEELDEEGEKTAAVCGAWTERGFFDGLAKLGADRHGDELYYLAPFIEEKIAGKASDAMKSIRGAYNSAKGAIANNHKQMKDSAKAAITGHSGKISKGKKKGTGGGGQLTGAQRARAAGVALLRGSPYALGTAAVGGGGYKLLKKKDDNQ